MRNTNPKSEVPVAEADKESATQVTQKNDSQNDHKLVLDFDDNRLLGALYGTHDSHLSRMEQILNIQLVNRGNLLVLQGDAKACRRAKDALQDLYLQLKKGQDISLSDVDGALRMTLTPVKTKTDKPSSQTRMRTQKRAVNPRSPNQAAYIDALMSKELVVGTGPAGTGKTYLAVGAAAAMLVEGKIERIILSRPTVEAGESLGFLPGDMRDKVDPYLRPLYDALYDMLPGPQVIRSLESGEIEIAPLAFMRGRTLANSFVILDEAQNATPMQMKMFLTRMGENSRMVITGDPTQVDLPFGTKSGLHDALEILPNLKGVEIINFTESDVVRHDMVTRIVKAYKKRDLKLADKKDLNSNQNMTDKDTK